MTRRLLRRARRAAAEVLLSLVVVFGVVSVWQAWNIARHLRSEARESSRIFGRIIGGLSDPSPSGGTEILLELVSQIRATGIPLVVTDSTGAPTALANVPFDDLDDPRLASLIRGLDRVNPPVPGPGSGLIHYGQLPIAAQIKWLGVLQLGLLILTLGVGAWGYRTAVRGDRERLWVAMARESAHQLGTPLMSAAAWVDRLGGRDSASAEIAQHLRADLERLTRVAQRFERIGRPARRDSVALGALAEKVTAYFVPRLPKHANQIAIRLHAPGSGPTIAGDPVLLEWALEALVRNAVDALGGRGGVIDVTVTDDGGRTSLIVSDDGPGIAPEVRATLFEPGVSTKHGGWGIGVALARRIVEDVHGGRLELRGGSTGATFVAELPPRGTG